MYYSIYCEDVENSQSLRASARTEHMQAIQTLLDEGRLLVAGPHPRVDSEDPGPAGFSGSLIVAEFESLEDAQNWIDHDPFNLAGVFKRVEVKPFKKLVPK